MCQKAVAGPFAVLAEVVGRFRLDARRADDFALLLACRSRFLRRLRHAARYRQPGGDIIELLTGAFDEPERVPPTYEAGSESKLAWLAHRVDCRARPRSTSPARTSFAAMVSYQHPDHDTPADWPPPQ